MYGMVRKMQKEDLKQITALEQEIFSEPWSREGFESSMLKPENIYLVEENAGRIDGYCGLWGVAKEGQICNVAVRPDARNQGIASRMLSELLCIGNDMGLTAYTLEVRTSNQAAIHIYKKLGFKEAGIRRQFYSKPKEDALIMWKR